MGSAACEVERLRALPSWLGSFHAELLSLVEEESGCCAQLFPDDGGAALLSAVGSLSEEVATRLAGWQAVWVEGKTAEEFVEAALTLSGQTVDFVRRLVRTLRSQPTFAPSLSAEQRRALDSIVRGLMGPHSSTQAEALSRQRQVALSALQSLDLGADSYDGAAVQVVEALPVLRGQCEALIRLCLRLTAATTAPPVVATVSEVMDEGLQRLQALVVRLKRLKDAATKRAKEEERGGGGAGDAGLMDGGGDDWSTLSGLFGLLAAVRRVERECVHEVERQLASQLLTAALRLLTAAELREREDDGGPAEIGGGGGGPEEWERLALFAALLREDEAQRRPVEDLVDRFHPQGLSAVQAALSQRLLPSAAHPPPLLPFNPPAPATASASSSLASSSPSPSPLFLSSSFALFARLLSSLHEAVFDVMFAPIAGRLQSFSAWKQWRGASASGSLGVITTEVRDDGSEGEVALPSFSLQPSEYSTIIGEYLLSLVAVLEPFVASEAAESPQCAELDAAYWLSRLGAATCDLLGRRIGALPSPLAPSTVRQLQSDLDYLGNVLSAMALDLSHPLAELRQRVEDGAKQRPPREAEAGGTDDYSKSPQR